jgi:hypothetical protein
MRSNTFGNFQWRQFQVAFGVFVRRPLAWVLILGVATCLIATTAWLSGLRLPAVPDFVNYSGSLRGEELTDHFDSQMVQEDVKYASFRRYSYSTPEPGSFPLKDDDYNDRLISLSEFTAGLSRLPSLETMEIDPDQLLCLSDEILAVAPALKTLIIADNLEQQHLVHLASFSTIENLVFEHDKCAGDLSQLAGMKNLRFLHLDNHSRYGDDSKKRPEPQADEPGTLAHIEQLSRVPQLETLALTEPAFLRWPPFDNQQLTTEQVERITTAGNSLSQCRGLKTLYVSDYQFPAGRETSRLLRSQMPGVTFRATESRSIIGFLLLFGGLSFLLSGTLYAHYTTSCTQPLTLLKPQMLVALQQVCIATTAMIALSTFCLFLVWHQFAFLSAVTLALVLLAGASLQCQIKGNQSATPATNAVVAAFSSLLWIWVLLLSITSRDVVSDRLEWFCHGEQPVLAIALSVACCVLIATRLHSMRTLPELMAERGMPPAPGYSEFGRESIRLMTEQATRKAEAKLDPELQEALQLNGPWEKSLNQLKQAPGYLWEPGPRSKLWLLGQMMLGLPRWWTVIIAILGPAIFGTFVARTGWLDESATLYFPLIAGFAMTGFLATLSTRTWMFAAELLRPNTRQQWTNDVMLGTLRLPVKVASLAAVASVVFGLFCNQSLGIDEAIVLAVTLMLLAFITTANAMLIAAVKNRIARYTCVGIMLLAIVPPCASLVPDESRGPGFWIFAILAETCLAIGLLWLARFRWRIADWGNPE